MTRPALTPARRRVLTLRHRDHCWAEALDTLFDADGMGLFYLLCLAGEGVGTRQQALQQFGEACEELLLAMQEARPEEGRVIRVRWEAWFAKWKVT